MIQFSLHSNQRKEQRKTYTIKPSRGKIYEDNINRYINLRTNVMLKKT